MESDLVEIMKNIRNRTYPFIGSGSGRSVFDLGDGTVAKVAKNGKGFAQNKVEVVIALDGKSDLFAKIFRISDDFALLIMEKADFLENMSEVWKYFHVKNNNELIHLKDIMALSYEYDLIPQDLCRSVNWGKIGERIVIIDYGFTRAVKRRFYSPF